MIKIILPLFILFLSFAIFAEDDYLQMAHDAKNNANKEIAIYRDDVDGVLAAQKDISQHYPQDTMMAKKQMNEVVVKNLSIKKVGQDKTSAILIFVSFSMPETSLIAYLHDAKKWHASVIIRGLIENSFQKTFMRVAKLVKDSGGEGMQLNPLLFKQFSVETVPAIVVSNEKKIASDSKNFDVLYGDVPLSYALKVINERGSNQVKELSSSHSQTAKDKQDG